MEQSVLATLPPLSEISSRWAAHLRVRSPEPEWRRRRRRRRWAARGGEPAADSSSSSPGRPLKRRETKPAFNDPWHRTWLYDGVTSRLLLLWRTLSSLHRDWSRQIKTPLNNESIHSVLPFHVFLYLLFITFPSKCINLCFMLSNENGKEYRHK